MENKKRKGSQITQENDKSFVKDGLTTEEIRKTIQQIRAYIEKGGNTSQENKIDKLKHDYSFFADRYPMLFDMCIRTDFNYQHLNYFLSKRDEIISDKISSEDASIQVGQEWFDKYVDVSKLKKKTDV
jgi:hypothetical protein